MNILISSIGTRGDMEPLMAVGEKLKIRGHNVTCLFPEQFRAMALDSGFAFESLGSTFIEMLESEDGKAALGGSGGGVKKILSYIRLGLNYRGMNKDMVRVQKEVIDRLNPDCIVCNPKVIYPVIHRAINRSNLTIISPVPYLHYIEGHSHLAFHKNFGKTINKLTFKLAKFGLLKTIQTGAKWLKMETDVSKSLISKTLDEEKTIYTISPTLFSGSSTWPNYMKVLGYYERIKTNSWQASQELQSFINQHQKILFLTFGSMTNPAPEAKTRIFTDILVKHKIPCIINSSSGGLVKPEGFKSELIYFVQGIPYDWVFQRMYATIHHGGIRNHALRS